MKHVGAIDRARLVARDAWRDAARRPAFSAMAALHVAAALVIGALGWTMTGHAGDALDGVAGDLMATVYLEGDVAADDVEALEAAMEAAIREGRVEEATYFDVEQEKARVIDLLNDDLLEGIDDEAIPDRAVVEARFAPGHLDRRRLDALAAWADDLRARPGVASVAFAADHVGVWFALVDLLAIVSWILGPLALLSAACFLGLLTHRALAARDGALTLMRSLGATERTMYAPFITGGAALGVVGACVAALVTLAIDARVDALAEIMTRSEVALDFASAGWFIAYLVVGAALGVAGAWVSVARDRRRRAAR